MRLLLRDTKGKPSWTLTIIVPGYVALSLKFLASGLTYPIVGMLPVMSGGEYAAATMVLLGSWVAREATEKPDAPTGSA